MARLLQKSTPRFTTFLYRTVSPDVLNETIVKDADICFEAKFESLIAPNKAKLSGLANPVVLENTDAKSSKEFKRDDNVWFCGTLRLWPRTGNQCRCSPVAVVKLDSDVQRYTNELSRLEKKLNELTRADQPKRPAPRTG